MSVELQIDNGVDIPPESHTYQSTYEKARVACATALKLNGLGMAVEMDEEDELFAE
jgi:hypothetical protein